MGLSFSVPRTSECPKTTLNIYRALENDKNTGFTSPVPVHGDLQSWADQGVLMLNNNLTTRKDSKNSHLKSCWNNFTQAVLSMINKEKDGVIFICWGEKALKL